MRILSVIVVGVAITILIATWLERAGGQGGRLPFASTPIHITGPGNTLASVARRVNDPQRFRYDPQTRTAVSHASLTIEGELQLGRKDDPGSGEYLELATQVCGDLLIKVLPQGRLSLYHSTIRTVSQVLTNSACSQGYALFVDGTLNMDHGRISYISGSTSQCLRGGARATIVGRSAFSQCDGSALSCVKVDGSRITIADSDIIGSGNWGLVVRGCGGAPLELSNCVLDGQLGAVFVTGESASVRLVDCSFDPSKIVFSRLTGRVSVAWTRRFTVMDAKTRSPRAGLLVRAASAADSPVAETVEARTNAQGLAEMVLTEWVARPGAVAKVEAQNAATPHRISVIGEDGRVLATIAQLPVSGKEPGSRVIELQ